MEMVRLGNFNGFRHSTKCAGCQDGQCSLHVKNDIKQHKVTKSYTNAPVKKLEMAGSWGLK